MLADGGRPAGQRRWDPLQDEWVLVSPERLQRPWQGAREPSADATLPPYDPDCHLCPGNLRAGGARNPDYDAIFAFDNDFPALLPERGGVAADTGLLRSQAVAGRCRVLCYSPRHDQSMARLDTRSLDRVVAAWQRETHDLGTDWEWVQCFENRGEAMGCSSPHPHGQIWALDALPSLVARERQQQRAHLGRTRRPLLLEVAEVEQASGERVVIDDPHWLVVVPYWARWPFETLLLPRRPCSGLCDLDDAESAALALVLGALFRAYDNLFHCAFPYSFGWHGLPPNRRAEGWQLHAHCYPPLLRSATVRKFMVGFELLAEAQRDLTAEAAAKRLRQALGPHWLEECP